MDSTVGRTLEGGNSAKGVPSTEKKDDTDHGSTAHRRDSVAGGSCSDHGLNGKHELSRNHGRNMNHGMSSNHGGSTDHGHYSDHGRNNNHGGSTDHGRWSDHGRSRNHGGKTDHGHYSDHGRNNNHGGSTDHGRWSDHGRSRNHGGKTDHTRFSSGRSRLESYYSSEGPSYSRNAERLGVEYRLKQEWNDLGVIKTKNWFNVIIGICDTPITEYDSYNFVDDKVRSWSQLIKVLRALREVDINERNIIFEKFVDYLRQRKQNNPSDSLTDEKQILWNDIKLLKQQKDAEWNKYHVATWKYWFHKEFATVNLIDNKPGYN
ncbi:hypothetical protein C922_05046 [Plasmodium inui San Antonio 1]|uniref:Plasmodium RESA N-terminal domain-containing protein n=1 Tax=Plasmodium inui San Antonio 1 TaxID=1237626 RepID=W6ZZ78_9APIC|nr:hypothetical protein C922_05046 [Plasmodium inui San Antonio 1]EUD64575.1 hypothetical protein C922_05046 [Plasmodium inui San Antonio 1]